MTARSKGPRKRISKKTPKGVAAKKPVRPLGKSASWLDVRGKALRTAAKAEGRRSLGRPAGASAFLFKLTQGERPVEMKTFVSRAKTMRIGMPDRLKDELRKGTAGRNQMAPAVTALAAWALQELKRRNRTLVVSRDDREEPKPRLSRARPSKAKRR